MSTRFSRRRRPQKAPRICVHKRARYFFVPVPRPVFHGAIFFSGITSIGSPACVNELCTLRPDPLDPDTYRCKKWTKYWDMNFAFITADNGQTYEASFNLFESSVLTAEAFRTETDFWGTEPYDTLRNPMGMLIGTGEASFRVTL